jgi:hypothetical protein
MSPEQLADRPLNHQTDIYSLGVVMYQLLTGRLPFPASFAAELMRKIMAEEPPRLRALRPELPEALEEIVTRAMQKDPALRYQSWRELGRDLTCLAARGLDEPAGDLSDARKLRAVRDLSFFRGFGEAEIRETLRLASWRSVPDKTTLLRQGERGNAVYVLVAGRVEVTRNGVHLATLGAGDLFGDILHFAGDLVVRRTSVRSLGQVVVLELDAGALSSASDACRAQFDDAFTRLLVDRPQLVNLRG